MARDLSNPRSSSAVVATDHAKLCAAARDAMGVTDVAESAAREPWTGADRRVVVALGLTAGAPAATVTAAAVFAPELSRALGFSSGGFAVLLALLLVALGLGNVMTAGLARFASDRTRLVTGYALVFAAATLVASVTSSVLFVCLATAALGLAATSAPALHVPVIVDAIPARRRLQAVGLHSGFTHAGAAALIIGSMVILERSGGTPRAAMVLFAAAALIGGIFLLRARIAPEAHAEVLQVAEALDGAVVADDLDLIDRPRLSESLRQAMALPTVRELRAPRTAAGMLSAPLLLTISRHLVREEGFDTRGRGVFAAAVLVVATVGLIALLRHPRSPFNAGLEELNRLGAGLFAFGGIALPLAMLLDGAVHVVLLTLALAALALTPTVLDVLTMAVVPPVLRQAVASVSGLTMFAMGGVAGVQGIGTIERRFGTATAVFLLSLPALSAAVALMRARRAEHDDLGRTVDELIDHATVATQARRGIQPSLLTCRGIDFSYGDLQVLFGVDFGVEEGEMVALLGTNGAGKSTLLRTISGLSLPTAGTIRLRGTDVTRTLPERRLELGITQIPGGRAVFRSLTVVENLRLYGYSHGRARSRVEQGIEASFESFSRLAERRNQPASTLSGGEQQMLGLSKALIVPPRLLLIDELSLGLAPIVVAGLLDMVRGINANGAAVVLVEQSVNVALSLVEHAYFMEKGEIRFDGRSADLLGRDDLLRSVFLDGATQSVRSETRE